MQMHYCFLGILRYTLPHFIVKLLSFTYRLSYKGPKTFLATTVIANNQTTRFLSKRKDKGDNDFPQESGRGQIP